MAPVTQIRGWAALSLQEWLVLAPIKRFAQALLHQGQGYNVRSQIALLFYSSINEEISRPSKLNKRCSYVDDINKHSAKTYTMYK